MKTNVIIPDQSNLICLSSDDFSRWFGNSKLIDSDGRPMIFYHGTDADFDSFEPSRSGEFGPGIYFGPREGYASMFGGNVKQVHLKMENPFVTDKEKFFEMTMEQEWDPETEDMEGIGPAEVVRRLREKGYDGIIGTGLTPTDVQYVVFDPSQVWMID